jgi:small conductance mechanosensitive channel
MEAATTHIIDAAQSAVQVASGIVIAYAFSIVGAIVILVLGYLAAGIAERWTFAGLGRVHGFDETLRLFISKVLRYAILILVGVTVLAQFGVQTASIIATLGAAGIAIGLALQGTLQNIASGIMLLVLRPFRVGEYITVGSISGTVLEIGLFATELRTWDGLYVMAPNNQLWNAAVTNYSRNPRRLEECTIGIGYHDDTGLAMRLLADLARREKRILEDPAPIVYVKDLGTSAIELVLRYWTASSDSWATKVDMMKAIRDTFAESGISMFVPQRELVLSGTPTAPQGNTKPAGPTWNEPGESKRGGRGRTAGRS